MITIKKEYSYGILAIVAIVAIVAIFNLSSSEITTTTEISLERENLAGESIESLNKRGRGSSAGVTPGVGLTQLNVDKSMLKCDIVMQDPFKPGNTIRTGCELVDTGLLGKVEYQELVESYYKNLELLFDCNGDCSSDFGYDDETFITTNLIEATDDLTFSDGNFELTSNVVFDYTIHLYNANLDCKYNGISNGNPLGSNDGIVLHDGSSAKNCGVYGFSNGFVLHDDSTVSAAIASGNKGHGFYLVGNSASVGPISIALGNGLSGFYLEGDYSSVSGSFSIQNFNNGIVLAGNHNVINNFRAEGNLGFGVEVMEAGSSVGPSGFFCNNYDDDIYFRESAVLTGNIFFDTLTGTPSGDYTPNSCLYSHFLPPVSDENCEDITDELGGLSPETTSVSILDGCYNLSSNIIIPYNLNLYNASLDCQGYTIGYGGDGVEVWSVAGLRLFNNSVVENCVVEGFSKGFDLYDSSSVDSSTALITYIGFNLIGSDSSVSNSFAQDSHLIGFYLAGNHSNVAGSTSLGSDYLGFFLQGDYSSVAGSTASGNNWFGFYLGSSHNSHSSVSDSFASGNGYGFFLLGNDDTVSNSVADGNSNSGFHMWTSSTISNSIASGNGGNGFVLHGDYALVSDSTASGNDKSGFLLQGDYSSIIDFTAEYNKLKGVQVENTNSLIGPVGLSCDNTYSDFQFDADVTIDWSNMTNITETIKLTADDAAADDRFGASVSISGDYAVVGSHYDDGPGSNAGSAYIFKRDDDGVWIQQAKLTAEDEEPLDLFGKSVSISGDYAVIGAYKDDDGGNWSELYPNISTANSGSAYIFKRDNGEWNQQAKLIASDAAYNHKFGNSVSISGDYAVIGSYWDDDAGDLSGSAYIFKRDNGEWNQQAKLIADDAESGDWFGHSVSISGAYAVIGADLDDDAGDRSGSAYIFKRDNGEWNQQAKLTADDAEPLDFFGNSVSISGDYAVVGSHYDDDAGFGNSGSAYIFKRDNGEWNQQAKLIASDAASGDFFGTSVSISGDYAVIGAPFDDDAGDLSGSAYIFKKASGGWSDMTETAKLTASDAAAEDKFGRYISIDGASFIIGSYLDDDAGSSSGSAYIFEESTTITFTGEFTYDTVNGSYSGNPIQIPCES